MAHANKTVFRNPEGQSTEFFDPRVAHLSDQTQARVVRDLLSGLEIGQVAARNRVTLEDVKSVRTIYGVASRIRHRNDQRTPQQLAERRAKARAGRPDPQAAEVDGLFTTCKKLRFCAQCGAGYYYLHCPVHRQRLPLATAEQTRHRFRRYTFRADHDASAGIREVSVRNTRRSYMESDA